MKRLGWRLVGFAAGVLVFTLLARACSDVEPIFPVSEIAAD